MNSATETCLNLRVTDVMTRNVITVSANQNMAEAAQNLVEHEVSGAPVVDEQGRCVGILSAFDFTERGQVADAPSASPARGDDYLLKSDPGWGTLNIEEVLEERVRQHMSTAVQTVSERASILEVARCMCSEHIHRLVVVDESARPVGIVTSLDLVAAMVATVDK